MKNLDEGHWLGYFQMARQRQQILAVSQGISNRFQGTLHLIYNSDKSVTNAKIYYSAWKWRKSEIGQPSSKLSTHIFTALKIEFELQIVTALIAKREEINSSYIHLMRWPSTLVWTIGNNFFSIILLNLSHLLQGKEILLPLNR